MLGANIGYADIPSASRDPRVADIISRTRERGSLPMTHDP
jgi:hypothetical protein